MGPLAFALYETAAALERAEASARVLAARARRGRGAGGVRPAVFAALASVAPEGLVPAPGAGAALLSRHLDRAALAGASAGSAIGEDALDALGWAAVEASRQTGGSQALDPQAVSRTVRRTVAAVRGLMADTMSHDSTWEVLRLGTFLPRAGWLTALLAACARLTEDGAWSAGEPWSAAAHVTGADRVLGAAPDPARGAVFMMGDARHPFSVVHALGEVESALLALTRAAVCDGTSLALARAASARLRRLDAPGTVPAQETTTALEEMLDAIGAVAAGAAPERMQLAGGGQGRVVAAPALVAAAS